MIMYVLLSLTLHTIAATPERSETGSYVATVISVHQSRNADAAKKACLGEIKRFGVEPAVLGALDSRIWVCRRVNK